ncbi:MAG: hypothetical protein Q9166_004579 [cf. Caloplaca sp. 2 TL-2023]
MPRLISGSTTVAISTDASVGFSSVKSLLQLSNLREKEITDSLKGIVSLDPKGNLQGSNEKVPKATTEKSRKENDRSQQPKHLRKSVTISTSKKPADSVVAEDVANPEKGIDTGRKRKTKKPRIDDQTKIKKAKVTKPSSGSKTSKRPKKTFEDVPVTVDTECEIEASVSEAEIAPAVQTEPHLGLLEAVKRRRDWTPTKDTSKESDLPSETEVAWSAFIPCEAPPPAQSPRGGFGKRLREFGFTNLDQNADLRPHATRDVRGEAATKKRKLEFVTGIVLATPKVDPTRRGQSPKKKPQTITDKATAPFVLDNGISASTLLDYFGGPHENAIPSIVNPAQQPNANNEYQEAQQQQQQSDKAKTAKPKAKKKVKEPVVLHPPELAMKVLNEQDLLFGTSSQLAREESPTFIRDLQRAVKESEAVENSPSVSPQDESQASTQSTASSSSRTRLSGALRNLWSVAARDDAGQLLDVDVVNLAKAPQASCPLATRLDPFGNENAKPVLLAAPASATAATDVGWTVLDDASENIPSRLDEQDTDNPLPRSVAEASLRERPKSISPVKKSKIQRDREASAIKRKSHSEMPNYHGYTDFELRKEVTATGFKNIRKREDKISHLQKCWNETQSRQVLRSLPPNTSLPSTAVKSPVEEAVNSSSSAKKRGRPPKDSSASTDVSGVAVSSVISPKKPRGRPRKSATSNVETHATSLQAADPIIQRSETQVMDMSKIVYMSPVRASPPRCASTKAPAPRTATTPKNQMTQDVDALFPTITDAVMNCPPTHDMNLTWYEKMLLYDPIVLEDLTDWLNNEGLSRVGYSGTVDPMVVKIWCESQSVCCLWKENLRGGTRARY